MTQRNAFLEAKVTKLEEEAAILKHEKEEMRQERDQFEVQLGMAAIEETEIEEAQIAAEMRAAAAERRANEEEEKRKAAEAKLPEGGTRWLGDTSLVGMLRKENEELKKKIEELEKATKKSHFTNF